MGRLCVPGNGDNLGCYGNRYFRSRIPSYAEPDRRIEKIGNLNAAFGDFPEGYLDLARGPR